MMSANHRGGKVYRYPLITINMTDLDVIQRVAEMFGVGVYIIPPSKQGRRKQAYRATVTGAYAADLMRELRSWMCRRRTQKIDEILTEYDAQETTADRRQRACQTAAQTRRRNMLGQFIA